jgi:two-component system, chemotaxis family, response regulator WspF
MRIAIVNDLALAREALRRAVLSRPSHFVAWVAEDGEQAVRQAQRDRPDVILMDLLMPVMDGVEATRRIMAASPCPILVVTATVTGNYALVLQAMSHGAIDAAQTPELGLDGQPRGAQALLDRIDRIDRPRQSPSGVRAALTIPPAPRAQPALPPLVALGASTGGPEALAQILERLPATLGAPVVVVQHISAEFATDLVTWLRSRSHLPVEPAHEGGSPAAGVVSVAVTNDHLTLTRDRRFHYTHEPADEPFRPNIDVAFESLAAHWPTPGVAALLTGMWDDGARGLGLLRRTGWQTIAQDQATSVVYGMPRVAAEMGAACCVLPVAEIAGAITARLARPDRRSFS